MPDISMCDHRSCPLSRKCYRSADSGTQPGPYRQAYYPFEGGKDCPDFYPISRGYDYFDALVSALKEAQK